MKPRKHCKYCGAVLFEYSPEYSRENPRGLALWEEEARGAHYQASPACLAAYREESEKAWEEYKQKAKKES